MNIFEILDKYVDKPEHAPQGRHAILVFMPFLIPLFILLFVLIWFFSNWEGKMMWYRNVTHPNSMEIYQNGFSDKESISIKWSVEKFSDTVTIFKNDKLIYPKFKNSGENSFFVCVNDSIIQTFQQNKTYYWQGFSYRFHLYKDKANKIHTILKITD